MTTNTAPRIPRDHYSVPTTIAVWLTLSAAAWCAVYEIGKFLVWVMHR